MPSRRFLVALPVLAAALALAPPPLAAQEAPAVTVATDADHAEFPLGRNDQEWMKHTLWYSEGNRLAYKPVNLKPLTVDSVPPKVRTF